MTLILSLHVSLVKNHACCGLYHHSQHMNIITFALGDLDYMWNIFLRISTHTEQGLSTDTLAPAPPHNEMTS